MSTSSLDADEVLSACACARALIVLLLFLGGRHGVRMPCAEAAARDRTSRVTVLR